jgi:probable HAF family extracellular repeat protein
MVGTSETALIDPILNVKQVHAVLWKDRGIEDLGTFGGYESVADENNNRGQVVGIAQNTIPDPFSIFYFLLFGSTDGTQTRAFVWQSGHKRDLGTLGGPDSVAFYVNEGGQAAGSSYTSAIPNPTTGVPTLDPFLWQNGRMVDLGNLGGTLGFPLAMNNRGEVAGAATLQGDVTIHPFLWNGRTLLDIGTLGGDTGQATAINDGGDVVGEADLPGSQTHDAFLWKRGMMTDLGNLGQTSFAFAINSPGQVVGHSSINDGTFRAFLWEDGGPMVDLNTLIPQGSSLLLTDAATVNDRGEITGNGVPAGCSDVDTCGHAFLLIPCDDKHPGECEDYSMIEVSGVQVNASRPEFSATIQQDNKLSVSPVERFRSMMRQRYHLPAQTAVPRD